MQTVAHQMIRQSKLRALQTWFSQVQQRIICRSSRRKLVMMKLFSAWQHTSYGQQGVIRSVRTVTAMSLNKYRVGPVSVLRRWFSVVSMNSHCRSAACRTLHSLIIRQYMREWHWLRKTTKKMKAKVPLVVARHRRLWLSRPLNAWKWQQNRTRRLQCFAALLRRVSDRLRAGRLRVFFRVWLVHAKALNMGSRGLRRSSFAQWMRLNSGTSRLRARIRRITVNSATKVYRHHFDAWLHVVHVSVGLHLSLQAASLRARNSRQASFFFTWKMTAGEMSTKRRMIERGIIRQATGSVNRWRSVTFRSQRLRIAIQKLQSVRARSNARIFFFEWLYQIAKTVHVTSRLNYLQTRHRSRNLRLFFQLFNEASRAKAWSRALSLKADNRLRLLSTRHILLWWAEFVQKRQEETSYIHAKTKIVCRSAAFTFFEEWVALARKRSSLKRELYKKFMRDRFKVGGQFAAWWGCVVFRRLFLRLKARSAERTCAQVLKCWVLVRQQHVAVFSRLRRLLLVWLRRRIVRAFRRWQIATLNTCSEGTLRPTEKVRQASHVM